MTIKNERNYTISEFPNYFAEEFKSQASIDVNHLKFKALISTQISAGKGAYHSGKDSQGRLQSTRDQIMRLIKTLSLFPKRCKELRFAIAENTSEATQDKAEATYTIENIKDRIGELSSASAILKFLIECDKEVKTSKEGLAHNGSYAVGICIVAFCRNLGMSRDSCVVPRINMPKVYTREFVIAFLNAIDNTVDTVDSGHKDLVSFV